MFTQLKHIVWQGSLLAMVVALLAFGFVRAEGEGPVFTSDDVETQLTAGSLDPTFSGDGVQLTNFGGVERAVDVAIQMDGKIVVVGDKNADNFALARYNPNGSLDTTFSGDGKQTTNFGGSDVAYGVAIQPDAKIVVSGEKCESQNNNCDLAVARYNPDGSLDTAFSGDGKRTVDIGVTGIYGNGTSGDPGIQSNGKIVVVGYVNKGSSIWSADIDFVVYRLNVDGSLDTTFGGIGWVSFGFGAERQDRARDLILQGGKIIALGETCEGGFGSCDFAVARLNWNGTLDTTFSGDGKARTNFGGEEYGLGLARRGDGKIVAVGFTSGSSGNVFAAARYNLDGTLDTSFNGTGKKRVAFGDSAEALDVRVLGNGKILVAGLAYPHSSGTAGDIALVRLNPGGSLDTSFSGDGKVAYTSPGAYTEFARALAVQSDGKYVLVAESQTEDPDFVVLRVVP
jgi:uncharacterized delta-60 repeat protein